MEFEDLHSKVLEVADSATKYAKDSGVPSAEAFVFNQKINNVSDNNGKIDSRLGMVQGLGIRVAVGKQVGFASCTGFELESIKQAINQAHSVAKVSPANPMFNGFVADTKTAKEGLLDPEILNLNPEDLTNYLNTINQEINRDDQRIISTSIGVRISWGGYAVGTTEGCLSSSLTTSFVAYCSSVVAEAELRKTGDDFVAGRKIIDVDGIGRNAVKKAMDGLGAKKFEGSEILPSVWETRPVSSFLDVALGFLFSGSRYVEKSNPWGEKLNQQVAVEDFNAIDDGQNPEYIRTSSIDTEGTPRGKTVTIEKGILKSFLFDRMHGKAADKATTGNANRGFDGSAFESAPFISPTTIIIKNIGKNIDEQIAEIDKGILIRSEPIGLFTANRTTGDFSVTCNHGFLIERGEIVYPLKSFGLAGNYFKTFNDIQQIGSDREMTGGTFQSPSITFKNHTISG